MIAPDTFTVCGTCGSPEVEERAWAHANTGEVRDWSGGAAWCGRCVDERNSDWFENPRRLTLTHVRALFSLVEAHR